jgi:hypothetical protein
VLEVIRGPKDRNDHVGPSGLLFFVGYSCPRPDGRGYFIDADSEPAFAHSKREHATIQSGHASLVEEIERLRRELQSDKPESARYLSESAGLSMKVASSKPEPRASVTELQAANGKILGFIEQIAESQA